MIHSRSEKGSVQRNTCASYCVLGNALAQMNTFTLLVIKKKKKKQVYVSKNNQCGCREKYKSSHWSHW